MSEKFKLKQKNTPQKPNKETITYQGKIKRIQLHQEILRKYGSHFQYDPKEKAFRMTKNHDTLSLKKVIPPQIKNLYIKPPGTQKYYKLTRFPQSTLPKHLIGQFQCPQDYPGAKYRGRAGIYRNYLFRFKAPELPLGIEPQKPNQPLIEKKYLSYFQKTADGYEMKKSIDWLNLKKAIPAPITQIRIKVGGKIFTLNRFKPGGHFKAPDNLPKWLKVSYKKSYRVGIYKGVTIIPTPRPQPKLENKNAPIQITVGTPEIYSLPSTNRKKPSVTIRNLREKSKQLWLRFAPYLKRLHQYPTIKLPKISLRVPPLGQANLNLNALAQNADKLSITNRFGRKVHECSKYSRLFLGKLLNAKEYRELVRRGGIFQNAWDIWAFSKFREREDGVPRGTYARMAGDINLNHHYLRKTRSNPIYLSRNKAETRKFRQDLAKLFNASLKSHQSGNVAQVLYYYRGSGNQWRAIRAQRKLKIQISRWRRKYIDRPQQDKTFSTHVEPLIGQKEVFLYKQKIEKQKRGGDYLRTLIKIYARDHFSGSRYRTYRAIQKFKILQESGTKMYLTDTNGNKREVIIKTNKENQPLGYSLYYKDDTDLTTPIRFTPNDRQYFSFNDLVTRSYDGVDQYKGSSASSSMLKNYLFYTGRGIPRRLPMATIEYPGVKWSSHSNLDKKTLPLISTAHKSLQDSIKEYQIISPNLRGRITAIQQKKIFDQFFQQILVKKHGYLPKEKNLYLHALKLVGVSYDHHQILKIPLPIFDPKALRHPQIRQAVNLHYQENIKSQLREKMSTNYHVIEITANSRPWRLIHKQLLNQYKFFKENPLTTLERQFILRHIDRLNTTIDLNKIKKGKYLRYKNWKVGHMFFVPKQFIKELIKAIIIQRKISKVPVPKKIFAGIDSNGKWIKAEVPTKIRNSILSAAPHDPEIRRLLLGIYAREQGRGTRRKKLKAFISNFRTIRSLGALQVRPNNFLKTISLNGKKVKLWKIIFPEIKNYKEFKTKLKLNPEINVKAAAYLLKQHRQSVKTQLKLLSSDPEFPQKHPRITSIAILSAYNSRPTAITEATIDSRLRYIIHLLNNNKNTPTKFDFKKYRGQINKFISKNAPTLSWYTRGRFGRIGRIIRRKLGGKKIYISRNEKHIVTSKTRIGIIFYITGLHLKTNFPKEFKDYTKAQIELAATTYMHNPLTIILHDKIVQRLKRLSKLPQTAKRQKLIRKLKAQVLAGKIYQRMTKVCQEKTNKDINQFNLQYQHLFRKGIGYQLNYGFAVIRGKTPKSRTQFAELQYAIPDTNDLLGPKIPQQIKAVQKIKLPSMEAPKPKIKPKLKKAPLLAEKIKPWKEGVVFSFDDGPDQKDLQIIQYMHQKNITNYRFYWLGAKIISPSKLHALGMIRKKAGGKIPIGGWQKAIKIKAKEANKDYYDYLRDLIGPRKIKFIQTIRKQLGSLSNFENKIGFHGMMHPLSHHKHHMATSSPEATARDIEFFQDLIRAAIGEKFTVQFGRPPGGAGFIRGTKRYAPQNMLQAANIQTKKSGKSFTWRMWRTDSQDWKRRRPTAKNLGLQTIKRIFTKSKKSWNNGPNSVLFHSAKFNPQYMNRMIRKMQEIQQTQQKSPPKVLVRRKTTKTTST